MVQGLALLGAAFGRRGGDVPPKLGLVDEAEGRRAEGGHGAGWGCCFSLWFSFQLLFP